MPLRSTVKQVPMQAPFDLLEGLDPDHRAFFDEGEAVALDGTAWTVEAAGADRFATIKRAAGNLFADAAIDDGPDAGVRLFGGFAFNEEPAGGAWQAFPPARFVLPSRQWTWVDGELWERHNQWDGPAGPMVADAPDQLMPEPADERTWGQAVQGALEEIHAGAVSKIVIARFRRGRPADPLAMLRSLAEREVETTKFLFSQGQDVFYGATPELLVRCDKKGVATHALAGSAPRGENGLDEALGQGLKHSGKEILEHELVVTYLRGRLESAGAQAVEQGRRRLRRLRNVQHLETPLEAAWEGHILDVAARLHPTPAVCGLPPGRCQELLRELEPFPRGWYTGAVGWFDAQGHGHLAVALRAALATPEATWLFAGAGIVAGSQPEREWDETEVKLRTLREALRENAG